MSISTTETDPVETIYDILDQASGDSSKWTNTPPEIFYYWERPFAEKGPGADQPPNVYVWSPTSTETPVFSSDGEFYDTSATVEVQAWSLNEFEIKDLQNDIANILSGYFADNQDLTDWHNIWPSNTSDFREQKPARETNHFVVSLEVDLRALKQSGFAGK